MSTPKDQSKSKEFAEFYQKFRPYFAAWGSVGGKTTASRLSREERRIIARNAGLARAEQRRLARRGREV